MRICLNGEDLDWDGGNIAELVCRQGLDPARKGYAVALNGEVLARDDWAVRRPADGDRVEIVGMYKGG